ncbi:MAG: TolC family protein [Cyclobacteriaceae bacterium]
MPWGKHIAILALGIFIRTIAVGQPDIKLTLDECIDRALMNNPRLRLTSLQIERSNVEFNQRRKFLVPEINAYARYFQYLNDKPVYIFPENSNPALSNAVQLGAPQNFYSGVTINQHLFDARMIGGRELNEKFRSLQSKREEMNEDEIYLEVVKTFYQIQIISDSREILEFNRDRLEQLEKVTRSGVENEAVLSSALDEFLLRKEELEINVQDLMNNTLALKDYMKFLTGLPPDVNLELIPTDKNLPDALVEPDSISSKEMEALNLELELLEGKYLQETSSTFPTIDLVVAFQWLQQEGYGDLFTSNASWFNQHLIGLELNIPIMNPVNRKTQKQKVQIDREIVKSQRDLLAEKNRMEQDKAWRSMVLNRKKFEHASRKVNVYDKIFQQESIRYEQAFSSLQDLLEAEEQYRNAQMELAKSKSEYFISILEMYGAYGNVRLFSEQK